MYEFIERKCMRQPEDQKKKDKKKVIVSNRLLLEKIDGLEQKIEALMDAVVELSDRGRETQTIVNPKKQVESTGELH